MSASPWFDLTVEALDSKRYRVTATSVSNPATVEIMSPFSLADLAALGDTLAGRDGAAAAADSDSAARTFGETLFSALFVGPIRAAYLVSKTPPVRLNLDRAGLLINVPWGLLRDPAGGPVKVEIANPPVVPRAVGGLNEVVGGRRLLAILAVILILGVAAFALSRASSTPVGNVDLQILSINTLPLQPEPGNPTRITITFKNNGSTASGPFNWKWYAAGFQNGTPDMSGMVPGIEPGSRVTVRGDFIFGLWGEYASAALIILNRPTSDATNTIFSDKDMGRITIVDDKKPFLIDFGLLPDDPNVLTAPLDLSGTEFNKWGIAAISADGSAAPNCGSAIARITASADGSHNQLVTGLAGGKGNCTKLPITITFAQPIGAVSVDFLADTGGTYTLQLLDGSGKVIKTATQVVTQAGTQPITLRVPSDTPLLPTSAGAVRLSFSGPGTTAIQNLSLFNVGGP